MVKVDKEKEYENVKFKMSEQTMIEAQIGFLVGITIGAFASWVFIMFFVPWEWYWKLFSTIGEVGIIGSLVLSLYSSIKTRRNYITAMEDMKKISTEANAVVNSYVA